MCHKQTCVNMAKQTSVNPWSTELRNIHRDPQLQVHLPNLALTVRGSTKIDTRTVRIKIFLMVVDP